MTTKEEFIIFLDGISERIPIHGEQDNLVADIGTMQAKLRQELLQTAGEVPVAQSDEDDDNDEVVHIKLLDAKAGIAPEKFGGKEEEFAEWNELYTGYLAIIDPKWETILKTVREEKEKIKDVDDFLKKNKISMKLKMNILHNVYLTLLKYTQGSVKTKIQNKGKDDALESYRDLYQKNLKFTVRNRIEVQTKVTNPDPADSMDELEEKLDKWHKDIRYFKQIGGTMLPEEQKATVLLQLVPENLKEELIKQSRNLDDPDELEGEMRRRIDVHEEHKKSKTKAKQNV